MIPYYVPTVPQIELLTMYLQEVHERRWFTNFGPLSEKLGLELSKFLGHSHLLPVSSCTNGLMTCLWMLGCKKVVTTPFSFVATSSSLKWMKIETHYVDIDPKTKNICPIALEHFLSKGNVNVDGIVATHVYGNPCDVDAIKRIALQYGIHVIYDAAHAFDVNVRGKSILSYGDCSALSFHATKLFHTVEGGAIALAGHAEFEEARKAVNFGIDRKGEIENVGINSKMSEYHAAAGLAQLANFHKVKHHRIALYNRYLKHFEGRVGLQQWHNESAPNGAYMPIFLNTVQERKFVIQSLERNNIGFRLYFSKNLNCSLYSYGKSPPTPNATNACDTVICLPLYYDLTLEQVDDIAKVVLKALQ
ncbi:DegT/DnrJ/EryC1/StrS family aminotransferase [Alteromonas sp. ASW11-130]|uniref:DegT/DnrJ/EryC1/StrS family aminotransferase n=1 Tax=Alteromonas sp. ASW11-130 TaxID=3015775 RepID=UPI002241AA71|nr:DegT/DnrJ/EryC1/StrS family aminotransferase [Alteromonas sp. ASW11-130]MCW8090347.1 DegT/DnrJ/EryC1/StrS family aminotransferase [Alteromonas sp. ASW11-130]